MNEYINKTFFFLKKKDEMKLKDLFIFDNLIVTIREGKFELLISWRCSQLA